MMRSFLLATTLLATLGLTSAAQAQATMSKADVEKIVRDYIAAHGDDIIESVKTAQAKQQSAAAAQSIRAYTPTRGPATAPITVIEFADFECPYCFKTEPTIESLQAKYGNKIRWAFKYLPLDFHKNAMPAAQAAAAAHKQGKFWEYSQQMFRKQDQLGEALYTSIAKDLKLDMAKFNADRNSQAVKDAITQDLADAGAVGARGTPYFLINGQTIPGALPLEDFTKIIDAELAKSKK